MIFLGTLDFCTEGIQSIYDCFVFIISCIAAGFLAFCCVWIVMLCISFVWNMMTEIRWRIYELKRDHPPRRERT